MLDLAVVVTYPGGSLSGWLRTNMSQSSHGVPVLVIDDATPERGHLRPGAELGPGDLPRGSVLTCSPSDVAELRDLPSRGIWGLVGLTVESS